MEASTSTLPLTVSVTYNRTTETFSFPPSAPLSSLHLALSAHFSVPLSFQKLLSKGSRITLPETALVSALPATKLLLIGPQSTIVDAQAREEDERRRKHEAFEYHRSKGQAKVRSTKLGGLDKDDQYRFGELRPFPESVPQLERRTKMLERLSEDPAVREVMVKHKMAVGILTELHPLLQPTLLGLNKNAGQEISLRILTDDLEGLRSYLDIRRVLLHELSHNHFGPHDDKFKTLNSLLNKEVIEYETSHGIRSGAEQLPAWEPAGPANDVDVGRTLVELDLGPRKEVLKFGLEDEVEERRDRVRRAAERRREGGTGA
ncbi:DNA-dependent metalloprotease WSS1, partial [Phenoliferia sp. Uapishka_3]